MNLQEFLFVKIQNLLQTCVKVVKVLQVRKLPQTPPRTPLIKRKKIQKKLGTSKCVFRVSGHPTNHHARACSDRRIFRSACRGDSDDRKVAPRDGCRK